MFGTTEFLRCFQNFMLQTFDDREFVEKDPSLVTAGLPKDYGWERLQTLNEKGAGIFFTVNQFPGGRRKKELCAGVNAWYVECDTLSIEEQMDRYAKSPLMPTFMVLSKKSVHAYWLAIDGTEKNFVRVQMGLQQYFQGDPAMKDIARVLRVPGFYHNKTETPFLVELIHAAPELKYTEKQMMDIFPCKDVELPPVKYEKPQSSTLKSDPNNIWEALATLDNKTVLDRLSGNEIVNGETYAFSQRTSGGLYILVHGKPADAWIDKDGFIGSGKGGGPTWIQWLEFFGHSKSDILKWAKENLLDLLPSELMVKITTPVPGASRQNYYEAYKPALKAAQQALTTVAQKTMLRPTTASEHIKDIENIFSSPPSQFTWGSIQLDVKLPAIEAGHYVVLFGQQGSGKTNIALHMARENAKKISKVTFLTLEMSKEQLLKRYARDRAGVTKEKYRARDFDPKIAGQFLPELDSLTFLGIDAGEQYGVADIERIITENNTQMLFIDNLNKVKGEGRSEFEITQGVSSGILGLTRKYKIPIIMIHHANKTPMEKPRKKKEGEDQLILTPEQAIKFRGISGMRGTNKTADDADIIIETARYADEFKNEFLSPAVLTCSGLNVYKDREFDARSIAFVFYDKGNFYDVFPGHLTRPLTPVQNKELQDIAIGFGGSVEN